MPHSKTARASPAASQQLEKEEKERAAARGEEGDEEDAEDEEEAAAAAIQARCRGNRARRSLDGASKGKGKGKAGPPPPPPPSPRTPHQGGLALALEEEEEEVAEVAAGGTKQKKPPPWKKKTPRQVEGLEGFCSFASWYGQRRLDPKCVRNPNALLNADAAHALRRLQVKLKHVDEDQRHDASAPVRLAEGEQARAVKRVNRGALLDDIRGLRELLSPSIRTRSGPTVRAHRQESQPLHHRTCSGQPQPSRAPPRTPRTHLHRHSPPLSTLALRCANQRGTAGLQHSLALQALLELDSESERKSVALAAAEGLNIERVTRINRAEHLAAIRSAVRNPAMPPPTIAAAAAAAAAAIASACPRHGRAMQPAPLCSAL